MIADLHSHSYCSDGDLPPEELASLAKAAGAEAFALTDHDTMAGVELAAAAAKEQGLKFVAGVELSSYYKCNVHVLGYNVDSGGERYKKFASDMAQARRERMEETIAKFALNGMNVSMEEVMSYARQNPSRVHIAKAIVARGYEPDIKKVFRHWLREGAPCYVPNAMITPFEAVRIITDCGGVAVLAHPVRLKVEMDEREALVKRMTDEGMRGIEASYKLFEPDVLQPYRDMAVKYGLFVTNGGDFHTPERNCFVPREIAPETARALGLM